MSDVAAEREALWTALRKAASQLPSVEERKMFGWEALFTNGAIFALVWKTGRMAVEARPRRGAEGRRGG